MAGPDLSSSILFPNRDPARLDRLSWRIVVIETGGAGCPDQSCQSTASVSSAVAAATDTVTRASRNSWLRRPAGAVVGSIGATGAPAGGANDCRATAATGDGGGSISTDIANGGGNALRAIGGASTAAIDGGGSGRAPATGGGSCFGSRGGSARTASGDVATGSTGGGGTTSEMIKRSAAIEMADDRAHRSRNFVAVNGSGGVSNRSAAHAMVEAGVIPHQRQHIRLNSVFCAQDNCACDHIVQLSNIPWPRIMGQGIERGRTEGHAGSLCVSGVAIEEELCKG